jgi:2-succinyl-5-enolpyruvyl-6-hydroxy-3-cyclohexene-1-carboxylate synthase
VQPDWVLRFGGVPTSKTLQEYLRGLRQTAAILVNPLGTWPDPDYKSTIVLHCDSLRLCQALLKTGLKTSDKDWSQIMLEQERRTHSVFSNMEPKPLEAEVLNHVMHETPGGSTIFCGNSMIIRDVDSFVSGGQKVLRLFGNRGTSGIDGNVSTALGMAAVSTDPLVALLGDLSLYHDMNGLLAAKGLNAILVVFNNGGGAIFGFLPQAKLPEFTSHWLTPTGLDIARIAHLYELKHHLVRDSVQFAAALDRSLKNNGVDLIEISIDRELSLRLHLRYWESVDS